jgi:hypothetical protein
MVHIVTKIHTIAEIGMKLIVDLKLSTLTNTPTIADAETV